MTDSTPLQQVVEQVLSGQAPRQVRLAASRGALPLARVALVRLYVALQHDEDPEISSAAVASLGGLGREEIIEILSEGECAPEVLDHYASSAVGDEELAERIAFHEHVPASAMAKLAADGNGRVIELVLTNQERILGQLDLLDRLSENPALQVDQRGRIIEMLDRATRVPQSGVEAAIEEAAPSGPEAIEEAARLLKLDVGELIAASEIASEGLLEEMEGRLSVTAHARILTLNTAQKAILAMRGGREERMILIRDSNQIVALSVLRNGRIQEDDVEAISRMRNVTTEVLRQVGQNRDWSKNYAIVQNLVNNPRTPPGVSTNFVARLQPNHLKLLSANRDAPELVRRMAKRILEQRAQKKGVSFKKH